MKKRYKYVLIIALQLFLFTLLFQSVIYSDKINTIVNVGLIEKHVEDNNLNMPFPNWIEYPGYEKQVNNLMNKNISEFHYELIDNYKYNEDYDCKYWTYVWTNYWKFHQDEYDLQVIKTDKHIFAVLSNKDIYCIADQINLICVETIK